MADQPDSEPQFDHHGSDVRRSFTPEQSQPVFNEPLLPPSAPYLAPSVAASTPRDSYITGNSAGNSGNSAPLLPGVGEKDIADGDNFRARGSKPLHKRPLIWALAVAAIALIAVAVVVPVYFTVIKPKNDSVSGGTGGSSGGSNPKNPNNQQPSNAISGGNGTIIKTENGTEFMYINPFGGICESGSKFLCSRNF